MRYNQNNFNVFSVTFRFIFQFSFLSESAARFHITELGAICSDIGKGILRNVKECSMAAIEFYGSDWILYESVVSNRPKGCWSNHNGVFWNTHETGDRYDKGQAICTDYGKYIPILQ